MGSIVKEEVAQKLPKGFVFLKDICPGIQEDLRYAGENNFVGRVVKGYEKANAIVCTLETAQALYDVQEELAKKGYELLVYDAYRPAQGTLDFVVWGQDASNQQTKKDYYPEMNKGDIVPFGYLAKKSGHNRGSTVDLTIIEKGKKAQLGQIRERVLENGKKIPFLPDGSVDMGSSFDLFHEVSHHGTGLISQAQTANREILRDAMICHGFKLYDKEWWHYTLTDEPFPDTYFDFPIPAYP